MAEKIEPALSAQDWLYAKKYGPDGFRAEAGPIGYHDPAEVIALANASLPDDDPRKITREAIEEMRLGARAIESEWGKGCRPGPYLHALADALESYLPPE